MKKRIMYLKSLGAQTIDQCLFGYKLGAYWVSITNFVTKKFLIETFFVPMHSTARKNSNDLQCLLDW